MEYQNVLNLLNKESDSKFATWKWSIVNDQSNGNYDAGDKIIYDTEVLKSNFCHYNNAYILVRGNITIVGDNGAEAAFIECITKIDETTIDDDEDLHLVMQMYNLLKYRSNYTDTTGKWWFYSTDETTNFNADIRNTVALKSFVYKTKLVGETEAQPAPNNNNGILKNATIPAPLQYLINFWRSLEMLLINCKVELKLKWKKYCVLVAAGLKNADDNRNIIFTIKEAKLSIPAVTLPAKDSQKLSKFLSKRFEGSVYWNEHKTKSENKNMTNEYIYFLKSNFVGVNRLFILV